MVMVMPMMVMERMVVREVMRNMMAMKLATEMVMKLAVIRWR